MKAILRGSMGLLGLLLVSAVAQAQDRIWISPVFKTPLGHAPSTWNSAGYYVDPWGRLIGPVYNVMPPFMPFNGILPGCVGQAIMSGNLPHTVLLANNGQSPGNVPMMGGNAAPTAPMAGLPAPSPGAYPMMAAAMMPSPYVQLPYTRVPALYPMQPPYAMPMPAPRPMASAPYYGQPGPMAMPVRDPRTGNWQAQNVLTSNHGAPFQPIPGFTGAAVTPTHGHGPALQPMPPQQRFDAMQGMEPMQMPHMGYPPPPRPCVPYPTHPFTRSPRDFFMWGEAMEEERARGSRPFPVP